MEEWRPIPSHNGYEVSSLGAVRSLRDVHGNARSIPLVLKPWLRGNQVKYRCVRLYNGRGGKSDRPVHNLVLEAFHGPRPRGFDGCHCDGNPENNHSSNLRWDSRSANMSDMKKHGTAILGSRSKSAKLSEAIVRRMRAEYLKRGGSWVYFGRKYGVSAQNARMSITGRTWKHVQ